TVAAEAQWAFNQSKVVVGELLLKLVDGADGRVVQRGDAEQQLVLAGVGLAAMAAKGIEHCRVQAFERLQDADSGGVGSKRSAAGEQEQVGGDQRGEKVAH